MAAIATNPVHQRAWALARAQHWVIRDDQLRGLGFTRAAIRHRLERGRLREYWPNAYAVGRAKLSRDGVCLAAVFTCGEGAAVSHASAAALWQIAQSPTWPVHISIPYPARRGRTGIRVHRRKRPFHATVVRGISITTPAQTIFDIAPSLTDAELERAINEADKLDLVHPEELREAAENARGAGAKRVRELLDRHTVLLTASELERLFLPLARRAGMSTPQTQVKLNGFVVDFFFEREGVVVETDGARFHRTPLQQTRDRQRDHAHLAAGLTPLRFTHAQVKHERSYVIEVLRRVGA